MRYWTFYTPATGEFVGAQFGARDDRELANNTPAGCLAIEGRWNPRQHRVDLATDEVVLLDGAHEAHAERRQAEERERQARAQTSAPPGHVMP